MQQFLLIKGQHVVTGNSELIDLWKKTPGSLLWVDIEGSAVDTDRELMLDTLNLPHAEVEDALLDRHPPSFSEEKDSLHKVRGRSPDNCLY